MQTFGLSLKLRSSIKVPSHDGSTTYGIVYPNMLNNKMTNVHFHLLICEFQNYKWVFLTFEKRNHLLITSRRLFIKSLTSNSFSAMALKYDEEKLKPFSISSTI